MYDTTICTVYTSTTRSDARCDTNTIHGHDKKSMGSNLSKYYLIQMGWQACYPLLFKDDHILMPPDQPLATSQLLAAPGVASIFCFALCCPSSGRQESNVRSRSLMIGRLGLETERIQHSLQSLRHWCWSKGNNCFSSSRLHPGWVLSFLMCKAPVFTALHCTALQRLWPGHCSWKPTQQVNASKQCCC